MLKRITNKFFKPKNLFTFNDGCGEVSYWKSLGGMPSLDSNGHFFIDYTHMFVYQKMEQTWYGSWKGKTECWGRNTPLQLV